MRFVSYRDGQSMRFGVIETQSVVPVTIGRPGLADDLGSALAAGIDLIAAGRAALASAAPRLPYASLALLAPVPRPGRLLCLGARPGAPGGAPRFLARDPASLLAPRAAATRPAEAGRFESGAGLAVVIGQRAERRTIADALDCVFGYSCFSDLGVDADGASMPETRAALGPSLVSRDELPPGADELRIQCRLDGAVIQDANVADLPCSVAEAIALLSAQTVLEPGDVITMAIPFGAGLIRLRPPGLRPVGRVEVDIDRVGVLTNSLGQSATSLV